MSITVDMEGKERTFMQMEAHGMIQASIYDLKNGGIAVFHQLTDKGLACMLRENVVKSSNHTDSK